MDLLTQAIRETEAVLKGKTKAIKLAFSCFLAGGHLLLEDLPGMGKTTLAATLAKAMGLDYSRVQFTSDMLPADILGASVFEQKDGSFRFHKGPVFTQLLLADEINRTTPKTQSALLEAMAEGQVTIDGNTYQLPEPFFVIATQNPSTQFGTFPLPESQLDRFLVKIELGYPDVQSERALLKGETGRDMLGKVKTVLPAEKILQLQQQIKDIHTSDSLLDYVQELINFTREHKKLKYGISPRGALALLHVAKAWAVIHGRDYVIPEDIQAVLPSVFSHRLSYAADSPSDADAIVEMMLKTIEVC